MQKKALLALLLAMTLLLSGCALIVKDEAVDNATEIIRMGDQTINKETVKKEINAQLSTDADNYYSQYGVSYDTTDPDNIAKAQNTVIESLKKDLVLTAKAKELGLDQLTDEEMETVKTKAQDDFDTGISFVKMYYLTDSELEGEELDKAAVEMMANDFNVTLDTYIESETKSAIDTKLRDYAVKDVTVSDEEIQADYDSKVESDKSLYGEKPGSYATAVNNSTTVYYVPAGVRRVKQILTKFKDEDQTAITEAKQKVSDANTAVTTANAKVTSAQETLDTEGITEEIQAEAQADLEAANKELEEANATLDEANKALEDATNKAFENIDEDTDAILASLAEGADWQTLMDEKNQDPGMEGNEKGYAVAADMTSFDTAFVEAAMALEKIGDYSGKVRGSSYGYYIIRYESDEPEGPVPLEDVKEKISSALLSSKQTETYNATVAQWVEEAGIKVDLNALKD